MNTWINPEKSALAQLEALSVEGPIVMLNLLRFDAASGGAARYEDYVTAVTPLLERSGAEVIYAGDAGPTIIGPEQWDLMLLVRYPSKSAFLAMSQSEDYAAISHLRTEALLDSRLLLTTPAADER